MLIKGFTKCKPSGSVYLCVLPKRTGTPTVPGETVIIDAPVVAKVAITAVQNPAMRKSLFGLTPSSESFTKNETAKTTSEITNKPIDKIIIFSLSVYYLLTKAFTKAAIFLPAITNKPAEIAPTSAAPAKKPSQNNIISVFLFQITLMIIIKNLNFDLNHLDR